MACAVCLEQFTEDERCPLLLSCGHTFCLKCTQKIHKGKQIVCPTCRSVTSSPVGSLLKNFALLDILEKEKKPQKDCEFCEETHLASFFCLDCDQAMCDEAVSMHKRAKSCRDHREVPLSKEEDCPLPRSIQCEEHGAPIRYFDEKCGQAVCPDCIVLEHYGHKCVSLAVAAARSRKSMTAQTSVGEKFLPKVLRHEDRVEGDLQKKKDSYDKQTKAVKGMFDELRSQLDARERAVLAKMAAHHKKRIEVLTNHSDHLQTIHKCLESAIQRTRVAASCSNDAQVVVVSKELVGTLQSLSDGLPGLPIATEGCYPLVQKSYKVTKEAIFEFGEKDALTQREWIAWSDRALRERREKMEKVEDEAKLQKEANEMLRSLCCVQGFSIGQTVSLRDYGSNGTIVGFFEGKVYVIHKPYPYHETRVQGFEFHRIK